MLNHQLQLIKERKNSTNDLNALLDLYTNKSELRSSLVEAHDKANNRPKTVVLKRPNFNELNKLGSTQISASSVGDLLKKRSLSISSVKSSQIRENTSKSSQQLRKEKMVALLSTQNFRKQLMNTRKLSAVQAQYRSQNRNKQTKSKGKEYQLRFNLVRNDQNEQEEQAQKQSSYIQLQLSDRSSVGNSKKMERVEVIQKKQYLKKNSSINKSILNTIIKLKLSKNSNNASDQKQKQEIINNDEIVKMIKVYKGRQTLSFPNPNKVKDMLGTEKKEFHCIDGWHNETENYQYHGHVSHTPRQVQSSQF